MSADRFVYWQDERPTLEEIEHVLRDFFSQSATVTWVSEQSRFYVELVGKASYALRCLKVPVLGPAMEEAYAPPYDVRFIEVWVDDESIDLITRRCDEYTAALADGLAELFARVWRGRLER